MGILKYTASWWRSRGGGREMLKLAIPMIISAGSLALMQFADRVLLAWYDPTTVGAAMSSGQFLWGLASFPFSVVAYSVAFVSQYNGAEEYKRIGELVWQGIFIGLAAIPFFFLLYPVCIHVFPLFDHSADFTEKEIVYFSWSLWGIGSVIANQAAESFFVGQKKMKTVMAVSLSAVCLNILLDVVMIFGKFGFPRMGIGGAALATSISQITRFVTFFTLMLITEKRSGGKYGIRKGFRFIPSEMFRLLKYGGMGGVQFFFEMTSFSFFIFILGKLGEVEATASAVAFNLNGMAFLPIIGLGIAVMSAVGNAIGEGNPKLAKRSVFSANIIGSVLTGICMAAFLLIPDVLLSAYAAKDPESFAPYYEVTIVLLRFISVYLFFDMVNSIFCAAIKGAGDTRFVMYASILMTFFLIAGSWTAVYVLHGGIYWCWTVMTIHIAMLGIVFFTRFMQGHWMSMSLMKSEVQGSEKKD